MKRKRIAILVVAVGLMAGAYILPIWPYRPYRLLNPNDGWQPVDAWLTEGHCDRFAAVLRDYGKSRIRLGRRSVLITGRLKIDKELTGNFSQKAGPD